MTEHAEHAEHIHVLTVPGFDPQRDAVVARLREYYGACIHADPERSGVLPTTLSAMECGLATGDAWTVMEVTEHRGSRLHPRVRAPCGSCKRTAPRLRTESSSGKSEAPRVGRWS